MPKRVPETARTGSKITRSVASCESMIRAESHWGSTELAAVRSTDLRPYRRRQRRIDSHRGPPAIRIPRQCPRRPQTLYQLVELALLQIGHTLVADLGQPVVRAQQSGFARVGTGAEGAVVEPLTRLPDVSQSVRQPDTADDHIGTGPQKLLLRIDVPVDAPVELSSAVRRRSRRRRPKRCATLTSRGWHWPVA
jgi:hypothetical protein